MKTDLTITTTSATDNKKVTNKISYVNPNLTNNQAITLAQAITDLTTDSYLKTTRTDTTECEDTKPPRIISTVTGSAGSTVTKVGDVYKIDLPANQISGNPKAVAINIDSQQFNPFPKYVPLMTDLQITGNFAFFSWRLERRTPPRLVCYFTTDNTPEVGEKISGTIIVPGDNNYAELTIQFEVNIIQGA